MGASEEAVLRRVLELWGKRDADAMAEALSSMKVAATIAGKIMDESRTAHPKGGRPSLEAEHLIGTRLLGDHRTR